MSIAVLLLLRSLLASEGVVATCEKARPGQAVSCRVRAGAAAPDPRWDDRAFDLVVPAGWDGTTPLPVILALHGGGGNRRSAERVTCPRGDTDDPGCLTSLATAAGFAVVRPDGTAGPLKLRTWNAGGGENGWQCVSGRACARGVDDLAYLDAVRATVEGVLPVEGWYATGLSNGGAMSYRLACERAEVVRGIAVFGAGNQAAAFPGCAPAGPVAILDVHGTADACWGYATGTTACAQRDGGKKVGARATLEGGDGLTGWATHLGCARAPGGDFVTERVRLPDRAADGLWSEEVRYAGCVAPLMHVVTHGGGHTVPGGYSYLDVAGAVTTDFLASERIVGFFSALRPKDIAVSR